MSARRMREAAALAVEMMDEPRRYPAVMQSEASQETRDAVAAAIRALPLPSPTDEDVERTALGLLRHESEAYASQPELLAEHLEWWRAGKADPDSCVHYSSIGVAMARARAAIAAYEEGGE
jgi:hypothetical protein